MKLAASLSRISPKRLFRSKSKASVSRSEPSSFSSNASSSSSDGSYGNLKPGPTATPISVLPHNSGDFYTELVQAFKLIDRDHDGVVSRGDLAALLSRLSPEPPSQEEVSLMLKEVDGDDDGDSIRLEELASRVAGTSGEGSVETEELREVFEFFDADRNGKISAEELHRVFGVIGDERCTLEECIRMIATVDRNGDGFVCFEDFCRMMELQSSDE
ncbi:hypothetical protein CARUB_v10024577mg [Capsella rubella]|uniref:EF-hand domain-containing protein n=1 Tax=Capsella rubella TaxID=81985 RepID=R0FZ53_9BRAS|nr:probable calcium-binding protein CML35 [Capsella rubella]EOA28372.1 hypothetical protein CARUB_v10024577mg [Capsella rubella]